MDWDVLQPVIFAGSQGSKLFCFIVSLLKTQFILFKILYFGKNKKKSDPLSRKSLFDRKTVSKFIQKYLSMAIQNLQSQKILRYPLLSKRSV